MQGLDSEENVGTPGIVSTPPKGETPRDLEDELAAALRWILDARGVMQQVLSEGKHRQAPSKKQLATIERLLSIKFPTA